MKLFSAVNLKIFSFILLSTAILLPLACGNQETEYTSDPSYPVLGRYLSTDAANETISVVHETVPGVMNAMRMNFRVDQISDVAHLQYGDILSFDMVQTERGWFARNITVMPEDTSLDLPDHLREMGR